MAGLSRRQCGQWREPGLGVFGPFSLLCLALGKPRVLSRPLFCLLPNEEVIPCALRMDLRAAGESSRRPHILKV